jgi:P27 family predicted phage terminase small subunit
MPAGRPSTPDAIKALTGNPGKRPISKFNMKAEVVRISLDHVDGIEKILNQEGREEFERMADVLYQCGVSTALDATTLLQYAVLYQNFLECARQLEENEKVMTTPKGYEQQSAWFSMMTTLTKQLKSIQQEFGMTPAARARIQVLPQQPKLPGMGPGDEGGGANGTKFDGIAK